MQKDNILKSGRQLIIQKGLDFLSVRKIASYAEVSVGLFYGIFPTIDTFVDEQNNLTLKELLESLKKIKKTKDAYQNINLMADCFVNFAKDNKNLWSLLGKSLSWQSSKQIAAIINFVDKEFGSFIKKMPPKKRKLSTRLIIISIFCVSNILIQKPQDIKVLLNTYLAGLKVLELC